MGDNYFGRSWLFVKRRLAWIGVVIVGASLVLSIFNVPIDMKFLIGIVTVILFGLYERMISIQNNLEASSQGSSARLYSLYLCRAELEEMLDRCPRNTTVVIDHLGLDMSQAWEYIHTLLFEKNSKSLNIEYRLLILTDDRDKMACWPKEVVNWSEYVPKSLDRMKGDMEEAKVLLSQERRTLKFSVKKYNEVPVMHGWSLRQPSKMWHVGHCRWKKRGFDWGGERYVRIDEHSRDPITLEIANLFDSYFEHLWIVSSQVDELHFDLKP